MAIIQTKSKRGNRIRATGKDAQRLFDALCNAHGLDVGVKPSDADAAKAVNEPAKEAIEKPNAS